MTVADALRHGAAMLAAAGVDSPRLDARLLLEHATGLSREAMLLEPDRAIEAAVFFGLLERRAAREPLALILGWQEFWSLRFRVSPATLIPRPASETLIEAAIAAGPHARMVLDLGTGTGCLLLAALTELPGAFGVGVDRSEAAARLAAQNAAGLGLSGRSAMVCAEWSAPIDARFDLVLCNPPYISTDEIAGLMPEVSTFEPRSALDGGADGLQAFRDVFADLPRLLAPGGVAVVELGAGQDADVVGVAQAAGLRLVTIRPDLAGIPRALVLAAL